MIPKVIHCVWLSGDEKPDLIRKCMASWTRVLPDYKIREWSAKDFDMEAFPVFVQEAYRLRKWAFVTDYLRLYLLDAYGGIYMDTDIYLRRSLDPFLEDRFFSFMEYHRKGNRPFRDLVDAEGNPRTDSRVPGICIQAALMGAEAGHPFLRDCMSFYKDRHYLLEDGTEYNEIIAPDIYALMARPYGFKYRDMEQDLAEGIKIYPSKLCGGALTEARRDNIAIHCCANSWLKRAWWKKALRDVRNYWLQLVYLRP